MISVVFTKTFVINVYFVEIRGDELLSHTSNKEEFGFALFHSEIEEGCFLSLVLKRVIPLKGITNLYTSTVERE